MPSLMYLAKEEFVTQLENAAKTEFEEARLERIDFWNSINVSSQEFGDLSSSMAFRIAKQYGKSPHEVAQHILRHMKRTQLIKEFTESSGYLNAVFDRVVYSKSVIETVIDEKEFYGSSNLGKGEKTLIEYPAVNPTKPLHVGHLRNLLLGDSLANILAFCGYSVEREDYIDDLGLQVAELVWGHIHLGSKNAQNKKYDQFLGELYVEVNKALEKDGVKEEIETILKKMEQGNTDEARLSRSISEKCVLAQYETAFNYKVYHNVLIWESDIVAAKLLGAAVDLAKAKGAVITPEEEKYKGTLALDLKQVKDISKEFENPEERYKVLIRSNGVATYAMKDFAFHLWKFGLLKDSFSYSQIIQKQPNGACLYSSSKSGEKRGFGNAKKVINIIDMRQSHEQSTVKALLKLTGSADSASNLTHVAYAIVEIGGKDLSGRSGTWLSSEKNYTADDLLRETTAKAKEKVESSKKISGKKNTDEVAKAIALSAIRFEYLRVGPEKKIDFSWERALNFDANSGPYVMYMYARARSILGKAAYEETQLEARDYGFINNDEFKVIKLISMAQDIAEKSANEYRPNVITDYLLDLSSTFSAFYERNQVIKGGESKNIRLAIVYSAMHAMGNMLRLLGVEPIESM